MKKGRKVKEGEEGEGRWRKKGRRRKSRKEGKKQTIRGFECVGE